MCICVCVCVCVYECVVVFGCVCEVCPRQSLVSLRYLDVHGNRLGNTGLARLCAAVAPHPTLAEWHFDWMMYYFDQPCIRALSDLLRNNSVLVSLPIDRIFPASPPPLRYLLLDALKVNVGLMSSQSSLLLPLSVRVACRQFEGLPCPARGLQPCAGDDKGGLLLDPRRLGRRDTWGQPIGEGAFGQVFRTVLDGSSEVCVKIITAKADIQNRGTAFFRELALIHELNPEQSATLRNVCVFPEHMVLPPDTGSADDMWLVLPFMANGNLLQSLQQGRLTVPVRLCVLADVASNLAELHKLDLLHRDLAARNVLLNERDRAWLCDLGLACRSAHAWPCDMFPVYDWAPELLVGRDDEAYTTASDTWSFGVLMLHVMLGGNPFWSWHNPVLEDPERDLYAAHRAVLAMNVQEWPLLTANGELATADEVDTYHADALHQSVHDAQPDGYNQYADYVHLSSNPVAPMDLARVTRWWHEHMRLPKGPVRDHQYALNLLIHACCRWQATQRPRMEFVAKLLACLAAKESRLVLPTIHVNSATEVLLLAQWQVLGINVASRWRRNSTAPFAMPDESQEAALQAVLPHFHYAAVQHVDGTDCGADPAQASIEFNHLAVILEAVGDTTAAVEAFQRVIAADEVLFGPRHPRIKHSLLDLACLFENRGEYAAARPLLERNLQLALDAHEKEQPFSEDFDEGVHILDCFNLLARVLLMLGDHTSARSLLERALTIEEPVEKGANLRRFDIFMSLVLVLQRQGEHAIARPLLERLLTLAEASFGPQHLSVATSLNNLCVTLMALGEYATARPLFERALAINEASLGPHHVSVAHSLQNLAELMEKQSEYASARPLYERALAINEALFGPQHLTVAGSLNGLAFLLYKQGEYVSARCLYERALAIREALLSPQHPDVAQCLNNLALLFKEQGDFVSARQLCERALAIREVAFGGGHEDVAQSLNNLAQLLQIQGEGQSARPLFERAISMYEASLGPQHPMVATGLGNLADLLHQQGDCASARPLFERALAIDEAAFGPGHPDIAVDLNNLAGVILAQNDAASARRLMKRALEIHEASLSPHHPFVARSLFNLATCDLALHDYASACCLAERALTILRTSFDSHHHEVIHIADKLMYIKQMMRATVALGL
jgi:tetratricopeptide (TPR) repeat protein